MYGNYSVSLKKKSFFRKTEEFEEFEEFLLFETSN